tara:strand:- start:13046 stop:13945 length:900 start_codon:yes stop_codon:yes gene_type:complete
MSFLDRFEPYRRPAMTALYALFVIVLVVGITGGCDFATAVVVCLSFHFGLVSLGLLMSGFDPKDNDHPWPDELPARSRMLLKIVDGAQLVTLIVAATQIGSMPPVLEVVTMLIVGTGIVACFVKYNIVKSPDDPERRMSAEGVVGLVFINTGGILIIAAIATLDGETKVLGLFIGALVSHLASTVLAGLTYREPSRYYRCPPSEEDEPQFIEWETVRYAFVVTGLYFLMMTSIGVGQLLNEGGNVVSRNCALIAGLFWSNGTALMHVMPNRKNGVECGSNNLPEPGELIPVLGGDLEVG